MTMAALKMGALVRFNHERHGGPVHRVVSVMRDGMVELHDMGGYFAPHLFAVADDIGDIPPSVSPVSELQTAYALANKVLDTPMRDPDDDLSMMSRQFLRARERIDSLRTTLEGRSVVLMGPRSPYWQCQYCQVAKTSPLMFPHADKCLLKNWGKS